MAQTASFFAKALCLGGAQCSPRLRGLDTSGESIDQGLFTLETLVLDHGEVVRICECHFYQLYRDSLLAFSKYELRERSQL